MTIDHTKVAHAARNGIPLVIKTHTLPPRTEHDLEEILGFFLEELGQGDLKDRLAYCLRELTGNAKKANTKRVYFQEKGLRLEDPGDYERGMRSFKADTLDNIGHYLVLQESQDLFVKVTFLIRGGSLLVAVRNNAPITSLELARAWGRIDRAWGFDDMQGALVEVLDDSEGAGLGIGILILMLRKMGLGRTCFTLEPVGAETVATLAIPMDQVKLERVEALTKSVSSAVESLPPFPDYLQNLLSLLEDPEVPFSVLAGELGRDPAMTADLIKYINSARHRGYQRIESLEEAVRIVGIRGLRDLMFPYGAHMVLDKYLAKQKILWENAALVSALAAWMAKDQSLPWKEQSLAQIAGLLYNLGQIVLTFLHPDLSAKVLRFCRSKGFSIELFDEVTQSVNPAELGAKIASKWKFPDDLVQILRHQNTPGEVDPSLRKVTEVVHLASCLRSVDLGLMAYSQIPGFDADEARKLHDRARESVRL